MLSTSRFAAQLSLVVLLTAPLTVSAGSPAADAGELVVRDRPFAQPLSAYGVVEPVAPLRIRALVDGTLVAWSAVPGLQVRKGEVLGKLGGAERDQEVAAARASLTQAESALALTRKDEAVARETYPVISDAAKLQAARTALAQAEAGLKAARARWDFVRQEGVIRAPADGSLTEVYVAQGEPVSAGSPLAAVEVPSRLWLRAVFYGTESASLEPGLRGTFTPAGAGAEVPVTVRSVIDPLRPDGGRSVGCDPEGPPSWVSGEAGTLNLQGEAASWPAVPESALVLRGQRWYVLVAGPSGEERREVEPGPESEGWRAVVRGLKAGERVVVQDVYLRFHRDVAKSYTPPD